MKTETPTDADALAPRLTAAGMEKEAEVASAQEANAYATYRRAMNEDPRRRD